MSFAALLSVLQISELIGTVIVRPWRQGKDAMLLQTV